MSSTKPACASRLPVHLRRSITNVASVPQRSPFRYPGGKSWLVPHIRLWLRSRPRIPSLLVEPFAGGGTVALTAVFENLAERALMVELDESIAAVWQVVVGGDGPKLAESILSLRITEDSVQEILNTPPGDTLELALQTIVRNRVSRGGIMAPGAGIVRHGENGRGLLSRWYPRTLAQRILAIHHVRARLMFIHGDGMEVMAERAGDEDAVFFVDPPYVVAARRLYRYNSVDHGRLFALSASSAGDVLMTYDDTQEILGLAQDHGLQVHRVPMKTTHHHEKFELLIGRDLSWARVAPVPEGEDSLFGHIEPDPQACLELGLTDR